MTAFDVIDHTEVIPWLRAQLLKDEQAAIAAWGMPWDQGVPEVKAHQELWQPNRIMREVEAKRRILDEHDDNGSGVCTTCMDPEPLAAGDCGGADAPCLTVRLLALPYQDRPGYHEEWRA